MSKTVITAALPYANNDLHIGHMIEYIQADIIARFLKLKGEDALYICASDMHGTPIEVNAEKQGKKPEEFANYYHNRNKSTFKKCLIKFDNYYKTHSKENKELSNFFFKTLKSKKLIYKKEIETIYCEKCERNLPDRYVKGTCPNCGAKEQYGDICESCGLTLRGSELINPKCSICGSTPIKKKAEHYFFKLSKFEDKLKEWLENSDFQPEIKNQVLEWINKGLRDWCISREGPYFGFKIPNEENLYYYVWLDAPIGYIASTKNYTKDWKDYWKKGKIKHIIGKDIIYFHFLFWPAMLMGVGFNLPNDIMVHGFLTVNNKKMSKSRGTFFTAREFLEHFDPEYLRFYYALHLSKKMTDIDLNFEDFKDTINNKLVANFGNFCHRVLSFTHKNYDGQIKDVALEKKLIKKIKDKVKIVQESYQDGNLAKALKTILEISSIGNTYFQEKEPWEEKEKKKKYVCFCANLVRNLSTLIKPILPQTAKKIEKIFGEKDLSFEDISFTKKIKIKEPEILFEKIEKLPIKEKFPLNLKVAQITDVQDHPNADKLYVIKVKLGKKERQIVAGLKPYYKKDILKGKNILLCTNLKPATIRGKKSNGMLLAADDDKNVELLEAPKSKPGMKVNFEGYKNATKEITFDKFKKSNIKVQNGKITWNNVNLNTDQEEIKVKEVANGAVVR